MLPDQNNLREVTFSLGVSVFPKNGRTAEARLRSADMATYQAKQDGQDRYIVAA